MSVHLLPLNSHLRNPEAPQRGPCLRGAHSKEGGLQTSNVTLLLFFPQEDYCKLLTKYAEAENTIDQLRLGAKVLARKAGGPGPRTGAFPESLGARTPWGERRPRLLLLQGPSVTLGSLGSVSLTVDEL